MLSSSPAQQQTTVAFYIFRQRSILQKHQQNFKECILLHLDVFVYADYTVTNKALNKTCVSIVNENFTILYIMHVI